MECRFEALLKNVDAYERHEYYIDVLASFIPDAQSSILSQPGRVRSTIHRTVPNPGCLSPPRSVCGLWV